MRSKFLGLIVFMIFTCVNINAQEKKNFLSSFRDSLDNAIDIATGL